MTTSFRQGSGLIGKWKTNKNTLEYLGVWQKINNTDFNYPEFGVIGQEAGMNRFIMPVGQWIQRTNGSGIRHILNFTPSQVPSTNLRPVMDWQGPNWTTPNS